MVSQELFYKRKALLRSLQKQTKEAQSVKAYHLALYILILLYINNAIIVIMPSTPIILTEEPFASQRCTDTPRGQLSNQITAIFQPFKSS